MARTRKNDDEVTKKLIALLDEAKAERDAWASEIERLTGMLTDRMKPGPAGKLETEVGDEILTAQVVAGTDIVLDEGKLKRRVGAEKFAKVTRPVLDRKMLEAAMLTGLIAPEWVAECSTEKERKKFVRIDRRKKGTRRSSR